MPNTPRAGRTSAPRTRHTSRPKNRPMKPTKKLTKRPTKKPRTRPATRPTWKPVSDFAKTLERMRRPRKRRRLFRVPRPIISFRSLSWCSCGSTPQYSLRSFSRAAHSSRHYRYGQRRGLVSFGFAPTTFLTSCLISRPSRTAYSPAPSEQTQRRGPSVPCPL